MLGRALRAAPFGRYRPMVRRQAVASVIRFVWDANSAGDNVTEYKVYWGASTGSYTASQSVGMATTYTINHPGVTRYYAVTALAGTAQSPYSNELIR